MRTQFVSFGVDPDRITVSAYGFDCAAFRTVAAVPADRLRVGFLGTLMVSKAPHVLLEAAKQLPRGSVSVDLFGAYTAYHGDDTYRARLDALLSESAGRARAHGAVPHSKVPEALASVDVLVVPSVWPENSPLVISEAFLAGVPVIASRIGGIPELVADGRNGLLFEPGSAADLARALSRLLTEAGLLDALRAGAKATRVRSIDDAAAEARRLYEALAAPDVERRPRLAAVVLNYRAAADTFLAVSSLRASRRRVDDLIVVDNDQTDAARAALARTAAHIRYVRAPRNLGYSGGMNVGIREALSRGADRVLLVNSDVVVPPDCVERLERAIDITPRAGITGPLVLARSDPDVVGSAGMSYRAASGRMRHRGFGRRSRDMELEQAAIVDGVSGCLMLVTREVFDAIGLLDEDYFFSFEDLDFCLRARRAGFSTVLAAAAAVHHEGGRSIGAQSPRRLYFAARGHLLLARRAASPGGRFAAACRTTSIVALNVAHAVRSSGAPLPVRLGAVARGVRDYFGGRFGPDRDAL
jgi:GT2 family glycosyltransferase